MPLLITYNQHYHQLGKKEEEDKEHPVVAIGQVKEDKELNENIEIKNGEKDTGLKTV